MNFELQFPFKRDPTNMKLIASWAIDFYICDTRID